jgi:hypothetical protein
MRRIVSIVLLGLASCGSGEREPAVLGGACSQAVDCATGLVCEQGGCVGAYALQGEVGSLFPAISGELVVALVDSIVAQDLAGIDCSAELTRTALQPSSFPVHYEIARVPPGAFVALAYVRDAAAENRAYWGLDRIEVTESGRIEHDGLVLQAVNLAITMVGPYACASQ